MRRSQVSSIACWVTLLIVIMQLDAFGQAARGVARGIASEAAPLLPILLQPFANLAGVGAIIGAGLWARGKTQDLQGLAALVAAAGGLWSAYAWLGWPYVTHTQSGWFTSSQVSEFSFLRLFGMGIFALVGFVVCAAFSNPGQQRK